MAENKERQSEKLAKTNSNDFKINYMQNIRRQRKKRKEAEAQ